MTLLTPEKWRESWLPRWPYSADTLGPAVARRPRAVAENMVYLQPNTQSLLSMIVIDVDHEDTLLRALERPTRAPEPSWVAQSHRGTGHVGYILQAPVCLTDNGRPKPIKYVACVQEGLRAALDGDRAYTGLLTKNPLHGAHDTRWLRPEAYSLGDLATKLGDLMPKGVPAQPGESFGLGRNVTLFDATRIWSYSAVSRYWRFGKTAWEDAVLGHAVMCNRDFPQPLTYSEVTHLARSVARWTWRNMTEEKSIRSRREWTTPEKQRTRGLKSGQKRAAKAADLLERVREWNE